MNRKAILLASVLMLSIFGLSGCSSKSGETETAEVTADIETVTLDGEAFTAADIGKNKLTVLNIWATWCPPCVAELPELQSVNEAFKDQNVEVVGVLQDGITELGVKDSAVIDSANALLQNAGANYRVILPDEYLLQEFISTMQYFPTTFFLDAEGNVVNTVTGANDFESWSEIIDETLLELSH